MPYPSSPHVDDLSGILRDGVGGEEVHIRGSGHTLDLLGVPGEVVLINQEVGY